MRDSPYDSRPYAYSLGPTLLFDRLAELSRQHRCWRKVTNLVDWMWLTVRARGIPRYGPEVEAKERERFTGLFLQALRDTRVPAEIKIELSKIWRELLLKMNTYFPVYFEISSFTYIGSIGAQHFYGTLKVRDYNHPDKEEIKLAYPMSAKQAHRMNRIDERRGGLNYKPGELSERFDTEAEVEACAKKTFTERYLPQGGVLILGDDIYNCPKILVWPPAQDKPIDEVNTLHAKFEAMGGYCQKFPRHYTAEDEAHDCEIRGLTCRAHEILHGIFYPDRPFTK